PALPFRFAMSVGVRKSDQELKEQLERALVKRHAEIERILHSYSVPEVESATLDSANQARLKCVKRIQSCSRRPLLPCCSLAVPANSATSAKLRLPMW